MTITFLIILLTLTLFVWIMCKCIHPDGGYWQMMDGFVYVWDFTKPLKVRTQIKGFNPSLYSSGTYYVYS